MQVCVLPVGPVQDEAARALLDDLLAVGLRARLDAEGSLGARIRASRRRRDCLIAVLGGSEVDAGQVQVTDVAGGFKGAVGRDWLLAALPRAHAARAAQVDWPAASGGAGAGDRRGPVPVER